MTIWVARLNISRRTAHKIATLHGLQPDQVRAAVEQIRGLSYAWHEHPARGRRAILHVRIGGSPHLVVLYPTTDPFGQVWNLGSAYPI